MTDPGEDICDAIVAYLNAVQADGAEEPNPFAPVRFVASKPDDPLAELDRKETGIRVVLVPHAESEEKRGRPKFLETHEVSLMIISQVDTDWPRQKLSGFVREIVKQLRGRKMAGYTYEMTETATKFDVQRLHADQQFLSIVRPSYLGFA